LDPKPFPSNGQGSPAPAVSRAAALLDALAAAGGEPVGLSELARGLGIAKSSLLNVCSALESARLIERLGGGYVLGRHTVELGGAYLAAFDEVRAFYDLCVKTTALRTNVVQLAILDRTDVLYLARYEGRSRFRLAAGIGDRFPAALTATGQAILATLPTDQVRSMFRRVKIPALTAASRTGLDHLLERLESTRRRGYAFDDEGVHPGVIGLAVPVEPRNAGGAIYSLGVTVIKSLVTADKQEELLLELHSVAAGLGNPLIQAHRLTQSG
jgi:DNA-binding IclR family transcriptional regulator